MRCGDGWMVVVVVGVLGCSDPAPTHLIDAAIDAPAEQQTCSMIGDAGCPAGQTCVFGSGTGTGVCLPKGTAALGAPCTEDPGSAGCAEGVCRGGVCVAQCDPFAATSPCPAGSFCSAAYDCALPVSAADPATPEHFCSSPAFVPCAVADGLQGGQCVTIYNVTVCRQGCRVNVPGDCPANMKCGQPPPIPAADLGVCVPLLDNSACVDGGSGTCAECRAAETGSGGCCAAEAAMCTTQACRDFVDCAVACKRDRTCVNGCIAADPVAAALGTPEMLCITGYGAPPGGACGDVCGGLQVCGNYDGPDTASTCTACDPAVASCRANGCYNGFYCERTTMMCTSPVAVPNCNN